MPDKRFNVIKNWINVPDDIQALAFHPNLAEVRNELVKYTNMPVSVVDAWIKEIDLLPVSHQYYEVNSMKIRRIS